MTFENDRSVAARRVPARWLAGGIVRRGGDGLRLGVITLGVSPDVGRVRWRSSRSLRRLS
jgi:hypothetical protein